MTLIVEDGSALVNSESYCSVAFADDYHAKRGNVAWDVVDDKEAALRKATDYMTQVYRNAWQGFRYRTYQSLDWPRTGVVVDRFRVILATVVPPEIMAACAELALRASANALYADQTQLVKSKKVGPIEVVYADGGSPALRFKAVDAILAPYLWGNSTGGASYGTIRS